MPSYIVDDSLCYCSLCDRYFPDVAARAQHVHFSNNHPKCDKCDTRFANGNALRNHYTISRRHHYCSSCDRHFKCAAGLRAHIELAAIHGGDDSDDEDEIDDSIDDSYEGWEDDVGRVRFPEDNDVEEPPVSDDEQIPMEDEYWSEDDEPSPFDQAYDGYAPVPAEFRREANTAEEPTSSDSAGGAPPAAEDATCADHTPEKPQPPGTQTFILFCPICLESAIKPTATVCGHVFCSSCIRQSLHVELSCPVCRRGAHPKYLRKLFFGATGPA
ncbi:hypothetical protein C8Q73DRAFT_794799 [Cubamyces lactineus]|nr:hypothetical protein C8Q73DRAFT_794799 [Cubamyces lactineus]